MASEQLKNKIYKWTYRVLWLLLAVNLLVIMAFVEKAHRAQRCSAIDIQVDHDSAMYFTNAEQVESQLSSFFKVPQLVGSPLYKLVPGRIEYILGHSDYIRSAESWKDIDGTLHIDVIQKRPLLRIKTNFDDYYLDELGEKMPLSPTFTARVPVATGNIFERYRYGRDMQTYVGNMLKYVSQVLDTNQFWKAQIEQIDVDAQSELVLIPKLGSQRIILGDTNELANKLNNLLLFYQQGLPKAGWGAYKTINVKYADQIVCTK